MESNTYEILQNRLAVKLINIVETYGTDSEEFKQFRKKHNGNKFGLMYLYKKFGAKSEIFYEYIKPFLIKQLGRFTYNEITEDILNTCYLNILEAHYGHWKTENGEKVWVPPYVEDMDKIPVNRWINFIITICRSTVSLTDYHNNKHMLEMSHNDRIDDCLGHSILDNCDYVNFSFKHFIFEKPLEDHILEIFNNRPQNNVLYNLVNWTLLSEQPDEQEATSYELGEMSHAINATALCG